VRERLERGVCVRGEELEGACSPVREAGLSSHKTIQAMEAQRAMERYICIFG